MYRNLDVTERDRVNQIGQELLALRTGDERSIAISFVALAPGQDTRSGSIRVTVTNGLQSQTSEAVGLYDALHMAREKLARCE